MKGVIIAAGYGTRFLPATKTIPKEMFPLIDKPAIAFVVEEFIQSGITDILIVSSRRKKSLEDYFDREVELESVFTKENQAKKLEKIKPYRANFHFVRQQEMKGTGDALLLAEQFAGNDPICVAYPDDLVFGGQPLAKQLFDGVDGPNQSAIAVMDVPDEETHRYGIAAMDAEGMIRDMIEKPAPGKAPSNTALIGRYLLTPDIFPLLHEERKRSTGGEVFQTGPMCKMAHNGQIKGIKFSGERLDVGEPLGYLKAIIKYGLSKTEYKSELMTWLQSVVQ